MARRGKMLTWLALWRAVRGTSRAGEAGLADCLKALPRLAAATLSRRYRGMSRGELGAWTLAMAYVLSPIDLVPELLVPLLGFLDDLVVATWLAGRVVLRAGEFLRWEHDQAMATGRVVPGQVVRG
jgi:uncharacterized membrane protein YkvA (DUF1232 family)